MNRTSLHLVVPLAILVAMAGCANSPGLPARTAQAPSDCAELGAEIARTEDARRSAKAKQEGAWKAVIPFAVIARYASGKADSGEAEKRLEGLQAELKRQGCGEHFSTLNRGNQ
jgi:hypothetical protein